MLVLPLRSESRFRAELGRAMKKLGSSGELERYGPRKTDRAGTTHSSSAGEELLVALVAGHALVASSERAFAVARPFVVEKLLPSEAQHDVAVHLAMGRIRQDSAARSSSGVEPSFDALMARFRGRGAVPEEAGIVTAAWKPLRALVAPLLRAEELRLAFDISSAGVVLAARGAGRAAGDWARVLKRQRPGAPFGHAALPRTVYLVVADRRAPAPNDRALEVVGEWLLAAIEEMSAKERAKAALQRLEGILAGEITIGVHRPSGGSGVVLSTAARVLPDQLRAVAPAMQDVVAALRAALVDGMRRARQRWRPHVSASRFTLQQSNIPSDRHRQES